MSSRTWSLVSCGLLSILSISASIFFSSADFGLVVLFGLALGLQLLLHLVDLGLHRLGVGGDLRPASVGLAEVGMIEESQQHQHGRRRRGPARRSTARAPGSGRRRGADRRAGWRRPAGPTPAGLAASSGRSISDVVTRSLRRNSASSARAACTGVGRRITAMATAAAAPTARHPPSTVQRSQSGRQVKQQRLNQEPDDRQAPARRTKLQTSVRMSVCRNRRRRTLATWRCTGEAVERLILGLRECRGRVPAEAFSSIITAGPIAG